MNINTNEDYDIEREKMELKLAYTTLPRNRNALRQEFHARFEFEKGDKDHEEIEWIKN